MFIRERTMRYFVILAILVIAVTAQNCTCSNHGTCSSVDNACVCEDEYARDDCSYQRKKQLTAFLLEFLLGIVGLPGIGRMYLGYVAIGVFHLLFGVFLIIGICVGGCVMIAGKNDTSVGIGAGIMGCIACTGFIGAVIWFIYDVVVIGSGNIPDFNGVEMFKNM